MHLGSKRHSLMTKRLLIITCYLFQLLYPVVFRLEDLQHFPVLHLSFVLLAKKQNMFGWKKTLETPLWYKAIHNTTILPVEPTPLWHIVLLYLISRYNQCSSSHTYSGSHVLCKCLAKSQFPLGNIKFNVHLLYFTNKRLCWIWGTLKRNIHNKDEGRAHYIIFFNCCF